MSQPPCFGNRCIALCQRSVGKAKTQQGKGQEPLYSHARAEPGLTDERVLGDWIVKPKRFFPDATVMTQTLHGKTGFDRRSGNPELIRRYRFVDGSDAANFRQNAPPDRTLPAPNDGMTARREGERTLRENPASPTALVHGLRHAPFPVRPPL